MNRFEQQIEEFFDHYGVVFNEVMENPDSDVGQTAELFSTCFIAANPFGVNCGQNNEDFRTAMKNGYAFYRNIGITSMQIISKDIALLDAVHAMTRIRWRSNYMKGGKGKGSIEFENIYFTQTINDRSTIFAYITADEQTALKEAGLL